MVAASAPLVERFWVFQASKEIRTAAVNPMNNCMGAFSLARGAEAGSRQ